MTSNSSCLSDRIALLSCICGHGGDAWHSETYGNCTYPDCKCQKLEVSWAIVDHKRISSFEYNELIKGEQH